MKKAARIFAALDSGRKTAQDIADELNDNVDVIRAYLTKMSRQGAVRKVAFLPRVACVSCGRGSNGAALWENVK